MRIQVHHGAGGPKSPVRPATTMGWSLVAGLFTFFAAGAARAQGAAAGGLLPENVSTYGERIDDLFFLILWITGIALIGVLVLFVWFLIKYRHREGGPKPHYTHGNNRVEVTWSVATAAVLVFIAVAQQKTWVEVKLDKPKPEEAFLVRVFAEQFAWHFVYPGPDGKFEPQDDYQRRTGNPIGFPWKSRRNDIVLQKLVVPVDTPVLLELNSMGKYDPNTKEYVLPVLHSFFAPNLRLKQDVVPFYPGVIWFQATKTGTYEIACAELCGQGHYSMHAPLEVLPSEEVSQVLGYDWTNKEHRPSGFPPPKRRAAAEAGQ